MGLTEFEVLVEQEKIMSEKIEELTKLVEHWKLDSHYHSEKCIELFNETKLLKLALQEIKEIVEKGQWDFAGVTEKQILQKISEVE